MGCFTLQRTQFSAHNSAVRNNVKEKRCSLVDKSIILNGPPRWCFCGDIIIKHRVLISLHGHQNSLFQRDFLTAKLAQTIHDNTHVQFQAILRIMMGRMTHTGRPTYDYNDKKTPLAQHQIRAKSSRAGLT